MSVDWALVFPSLLLEGSSSTNMNGFCVTSLIVKGVKVRLDNITLLLSCLSFFIARGIKFHQYEWFLCNQSEG